MPDERPELLFYCPPRQPRVIHDFAEVAERLNRSKAGATARVVPARGAPVAGAFLRSAARGAISIEMEHPKPFPPVRALRLRHWKRVNKVAEYDRLKAAGAPVPRWVEIKPDTVLDPKEWGPYVVVKPAAGRKGAFVFVQRTGRVRYRPRADFPQGHLGRDGPMIAQEFIYTGPWPIAYRVSTYLGRAVTAISYEGRKDFPPLADEFSFGQSGGRSIVAAAMGGRISLIFDSDIIALAEWIHRSAFPEIPSLGVDIVRHARTGKLYVMECNLRGKGMLLTNSREGMQMQREFNLDFYGQFGAIDVMTEATEAFLKSVTAGSRAAN